MVTRLLSNGDLPDEMLGLFNEIIIGIFQMIPNYQKFENQSLSTLSSPSLLIFLEIEPNVSVIIW